MTEWMRRGRKVQMFLLDLLYPNRCPCCKRHIPWHEYLCKACALAVTAYPDDAFCPYCGKQPENCICDTEPAYDQAVVLTAYSDAARHGVLSMKVGESLSFGRFCGGILARRILSDEERYGADVVMPVPMCASKKRKRGCNPAAVLAKEIAEQTGIPYREDILRDNGKGKAQHTLSAEERRENVAQFSAAPVSLEHRRILLCDDVLTTGATMNRCAALLKGLGAAQVTAVAATTTLWKEEMHSD